MRQFGQVRTVAVTATAQTLSSGVRIVGRIAMVTLMLSGFVFVETTIHAMAIVQFDAMADEDKSRFIADLVEGAQTVLTADGHIEQAARVERLFNEVLHRDQKSVGFVQLQNNIALARC